MRRLKREREGENERRGRVKREEINEFFAKKERKKKGGKKGEIRESCIQRTIRIILFAIYENKNKLVKLG